MREFGTEQERRVAKILREAGTLMDQKELINKIYEGQAIPRDPQNVLRVVINRLRNAGYAIEFVPAYRLIKCPDYEDIS